MGWSVGYDPQWQRDVGYGVPAWCDHPDCTESVDRGLSYVCGGEPFGGDAGCGLFFCENHLGYAYTQDGYEDLRDDNGNVFPAMCERCIEHHRDGTEWNPFPPSKDHPEWVNHKLTHESWATWRDEHPYHVAAMKLVVS